MRPTAILDHPFLLPWIGADGQALTADIDAWLFNSNPSIKGQDTVFIGKKRVDIELINGGKIGNDLSHLDHGERDGIQISGRSIPVTGQLAIDPGLLNRCPGQVHVQGR